MNLQYNVVLPQELELLLDLMRQFYAIDNYPFKRETARQVVGNFLETPELGRVWFIILNDRPIGYIVLAFSYSFEFKGRNAFIDEFFILKEFRNKGIGNLTLDFVMPEAKKLGVKAIHLEAERHNDRAKALYRKFNFKDHDRHLLTRIMQ